MKDKLLRELGEATARVSKSETDWKALAKSVAALEHELDIERKKQLRAPCALPFRVG